MTSTNIWGISEGGVGKKTNVLLLTLNSLGRADLSSIPAGGNRKNQRQSNVKSGNHDLIIDGNRTAFVQSKSAKAAKPAQQKQAKPAKQAKQAKAAKAAKPRSTNRPGRPKSFPRKVWASLSLQQQVQLVRTGNYPVSNPPRGAKAAKAVNTRIVDDTRTNTRVFGAGDFDWGASEYREHYEI